MDLGLREWVMVISAGVAVLVVGHAVWVRIRDRSALKLEIDRTVSQDNVDDLALLRGELPNGGARVVKVFDPVERATSKGQPASRGAARTAPTVSLDPTPVRSEPTVDGSHDADGPGRSQRDDAATPTVESLPEVRATAIFADDAADEPSQAVVQGAMSSAASAAEVSDRANVREPNRNNTPETTLHAPGIGTTMPNELMVVHVLSRDSNGFPGEQLVQAASRCGLKFGDMNIFHRYRDGKPQKQRIEYSMANAVEPGTFDLANIHEQATPGVSFFFQLPGPSEPLKAFEDMIGVARTLATSLNGDLKDDNMSVMTSQTIEHCRERIREFSRRSVARA